MSYKSPAACCLSSLCGWGGVGKMTYVTIAGTALSPFPLTLCTFPDVFYSFLPALTHCFLLVVKTFHPNLIKRELGSHVDRCLYF